MEPMSPILPSHPEMPEVVYAKDQPQYKPLPAVHLSYEGGEVTVVTRWRLTWRERIKVLWRGCFWFEQMTFGAPLQPQLPMVDEPLKDAGRLEIKEMPVR